MNHKTITERLDLLEFKANAIQANINEVKDYVERIYNGIGVISDGSESVEPVETMAPKD